MPDSPLEQMQLIFVHLNGMIRTANLYQSAHPQTRKAKQAFHEALQSYLDAQGWLTYRFMGDLLIANDRILPRESLVYRRFLDLCQTERRIGSLSFAPGVEEREIASVLEAFTDGVGPSLSEWMARQRLTHVTLGPPIEADRQSGEAIARRAYSGTVEAMRDIDASIRSRQPLSMEQLSTLGVLTSAMLQQIVTDPGLALRLACIKSYDEYTLYHSVNVCVISIGIGVAIGLADNILRELAVAAVLHDLGKIAIPLEILRKPGVLEEPEWRIMRRHPVRGADLLSRMPGSNRLPMIVSFEHQMRYDLKGYPFVREDWTQHPFSRIVSLADIFDAMTTRRAYKQAIPTEKVLAYLRDEAGKACDPRLVTVLVQMVRALPAEEPAEAAT
jgi:HD-GYP domain-containing protein (c-di-GMP phosphodiesterase class II)